MSRARRQQKRAARQERRASPKGQKRKKRIGLIARTILTGGANLPIEHTRMIAQKLLGKHKKKMQKFVADEGGQEPSEDVEELALQTANVRQQKIQEIQDDPTNDANTPAEAEDLFEEQQEEELESENYEGESNAFTGAAMGAILGVAKGLVGKIKERRFAKGKKFFGKTQAQYAAKGGPDVEVDGSGNIVASRLTNEGSKDPLSNAVNDATGEATMTTLKQYLPIALIALVLFFLLKKK